MWGRGLSLLLNRTEAKEWGGRPVVQPDGRGNGPAAGASAAEGPGSPGRSGGAHTHQGSPGHVPSCSPKPMPPATGPVPTGRPWRSPTCSGLMLWSSKTMRSRWEARSPSMCLWLDSARSSVRMSCVCWATVRWLSMACAKGLGLSGRGHLPSRQPPALLHVAGSQGGSSALTQRRADARCLAWQGPHPCGCGP